MGFDCPSDSRDWFAVVRCLTCEGSGVNSGDVLIFDVLPHLFARREWRGWEWLVWGRGELAIPESALCGVGAVLGVCMEKVEGEKSKRGRVYRITYGRESE